MPSNACLKQLRRDEAAIWHALLCGGMTVPFLRFEIHQYWKQQTMHAMKDGYTTLESASSVNPLKSQTSPSDWEIAETVQSLTPRSLAKLKNMVDAKSTAME